MNSTNPDFYKITKFYFEHKFVFMVTQTCLKLIQFFVFVRNINWGLGNEFLITQFHSVNESPKQVIGPQGRTNKETITIHIKKKVVVSVILFLWTT